MSTGVAVQRVLERLPGARRNGVGWKAICPSHADHNPSLGIGQGDRGALLTCYAGCELPDVLNALGLQQTDLFDDTGRSQTVSTPKRRIVTAYDYRDERGELLYQAVRYEPKDFRQRRPDPSSPGAWLWNLDGVRRVPYRAPELTVADPSAVVFVVEGEKDVDRLTRIGLVATCNVGGAKKWRREYGELLRGRHVRVIPDNDEPGHEHADQVRQALASVAASVRVLELPALPPKGDVSDWLDAGGTAAQLQSLAGGSETGSSDAQPINSRPALAPRTIDQVEQAFRRWLYLADAGPVYAVLGTIAANLRAGDPVWLMLVGASSGGKTEVINSLSGLPNVHAAATLTEGALLSGTPKREKDREAKGGLLRQIGDFGILLCKDFTSVLSMSRDPRAGLLAALREIYDGSWTRHVGVDGGRTLAWHGKLGLIAGCTAAIDSHHGVIATMGERFLFYRLPEIDPSEQAR